MRSRGVTFWGWFFIFSAISGLLGVMDPEQSIRIYGIGLLVLTIATSVAYLICGIFVLKLNESARKAVIILGLLSILLYPFYIRAVIGTMDLNTVEVSIYEKAKQKIMKETKPEYQQKALENLDKRDKESRKMMVPVLLVLFGVPLTVLEFIPIYFFTRPKVKEQFVSN